jgi:VanZ family protein
LVASLQIVHAGLRKLSHATASAILAFLWVRPFRWDRRVAPGPASWAALAVCIACATVDELHQASVPGRPGSVLDIVIDSAGAAVMLLVLRSRRGAADAAVEPALDRAAPPAARYDESS